MSAVTAIDIIVRAIEEEGVTHLFGVPGGQLVPLFESVADGRQITPILAKHEEGAGFMAEGYARVRHGLGVCCGTSGPGATNALTAVASAQSDSVPLLFLSGQVSTSAFDKGGLQDSSGGHWRLDTVDLFRTVTKFSAMLHTPHQAPHLIRRALRAALTGRRGAVHLSLPVDVVKQPVVRESAEGGSYRPRVEPAGDRNAIREAVVLLKGAKRPAVLAGHGVNLARGWAALQELAERLDMPVATTLKGKSSFPETHPLALGVFGFTVNPAADALLLSEAVDVLLIVGTSLGEWQTNSWDPALTRGRTVIHIDIDPMEIGKNYAVDLGVVGDARSVLVAMVSELGDRNGSAWSVRDVVSVRPSAGDLQDGRTLLKPQAVAARLSEMMPEDALLFVDTGNCLSWIAEFFVAKRAGSVFYSSGIASMGYSVPAAIGGKLAAPERPVVAVLGDAAFAMNGMEVHTAVEYGIPVVWVVLNNAGHGMIYNGEMLISGRSFISRFSGPMDIAAIAAGLGARSARVTTLSEFSDCFEAALKAREPTVIDVAVDIEEIPSSLRRRVALLNTFLGKDEAEHA